MSGLNFSLQSAVICDQIRVENTGKLILIGVYTGNVNVQSVPTDMTLSCFLTGVASGRGEVVLSFRFSAIADSTGETEFWQEGEVTIGSSEAASENSEQISFPSPPLSLTVGEAMTLRAEWKLKDDEDWVSLLEKRIEVKNS